MADSYDIVVVGGGIHGVGVAQAAAAAGHSALLLEKQGLASGTSGRSSKLIHGGLRYLESGRLSLVSESLRERALLLRLAPDLVKLQSVHIPVFRRTRRRPLLIRAGLSLYAILGHLGKAFRFETVPRSRWGDLDGLITDDLEVVFRYFDGQTDDARLTTAVMQSAMSLGAELALPALFHSAELHREGCEVRYLVGGRGNGGGENAGGGSGAGGADAGQEKTCRARVLVNAAGPWANRILDRITPRQHPMPIELVQGAHILVEGGLEHGIYYVESPRDGRAVFVMPRGNKTLVGTTEVRFRGEDPDDVHALRCERIYLARVLKRFFPRFLPGGPKQILDAWAGIRVLPARPGHAFHRSRETILAVDGHDGAGPPRLLTIYGGKLTTYRSTAAKVMERIAPALPSGTPVADTRELSLEPPDAE
ncbi:MAG: FAD-dependent oxidoreductase [Candidatus Palauibacterales bacterium]|nr:FAD-dependent oxidoreductase [Candidatus Palauibacterales bacterium]